MEPIQLNNIILSIIAALLGIVGFFVIRMLNRVEHMLSDHETRLRATELDVKGLVTKAGLIILILFMTAVGFLSWSGSPAGYRASAREEHSPTPTLPDGEGAAHLFDKQISQYEKSRVQQGRGVCQLP